MDSSTDRSAARLPLAPGTPVRVLRVPNQAIWLHERDDPRGVGVLSFDDFEIGAVEEVRWYGDPDDPRAVFVYRVQVFKDSRDLFIDVDRHWVQAIHDCDDPPLTST